MGVQSLMQTGFAENWKGSGRGFSRDIIRAIDYYDGDEDEPVMATTGVCLFIVDDIMSKVSLAG